MYLNLLYKLYVNICILSNDTYLTLLKYAWICVSLFFLFVLSDASIDVAIISNWNGSKVQKKKKLKRDINVYASSERDKRLSKLKLECEVLFFMMHI